MDLDGYLLGHASEEERVAIEARLARDPDFHLELLVRRAMLQPLASDPDDEPPQGLADRVIAAASDPILTANAAAEWAPHSPAMRWIDVAVAASLLFVAAVLVVPAIASLRGEESRIACANNLRQVAVAMNGYQTAERGVLPSSDPLGPLNHAGVFALLLHATDYMADPNILICPSADNAVVYVPKLAEYLATPADSVLRELQRRQMAGSYGYSLGKKEGGEYRPPAGTGSRDPVLADRPRRESESGPVGNSPNHGGMGENVLFADGHVEFLGQPKIGSDNIFCNDREEVGAGLDLGDACIGPSEAVPFPLPVPSAKYQ